MGYRHLTLHALKPKHIEALVARWLAEKLSPGTIKNRMSALRWVAEKIGKPNIVARTNLGYPVDCQSCYRVSPLTTVERLVSGC